MTLAFGFFEADRAYRVKRAFVDLDGREHAIGETWTYIGHTFVPYHDGLTLDVRLPSGERASLRFQLTPEAQGPLFDRLADHFERA
jgi:hypothetical protein